MPPIAGFHHHFYQPPREDPWLGESLNEWSAWPYHDWNERITAECYRALLAVELPNEDGSNELYEPLIGASFDVGPTLHHWLERHAPDVNRSLGFQVHASTNETPAVIAAPLVHAILPLANESDKQRLVAWGVADYVHRFGRPPQGMWLPETAVDLETLEVLADHHISYTILMPGQAVRVRAPGGEWRAVTADTLDTSRAYVVRLTSGRAMKVVFGHTSLSQRVAFGDLLGDGTRLADTMITALGPDDGVVLVVADGETYGHHHRFGDLGMAWAQRRIASHYGIATHLGDWIVHHEPDHEVELAKESAWSCAHGVERWRGDCGCVTGEQPGWRQTWRAPLRGALDWLRVNLGAVADQALSLYVASVDETLLDYGMVIAGVLDRSEFVSRHAIRTLNDDETSTVLELCEAHRNLLYSFTSCAWFFADPAEIETYIVLRYAAVAIEVVNRSLNVDFEPDFLTQLSHVLSNRPDVGGDELWHAACDPYRVDEATIAAGFAAERFVRGAEARPVRGHWRATFAESSADESLVVTITNILTLRHDAFNVEAQRVGTTAMSVRVDGRGEVRDFTLGELGDDVIARIVTSRLVDSRSTDVESALTLLVAELLERPARSDDVSALVALASALRYASPLAEASVRRALTALTSGARSDADLGRLTPLARAVHMVETLDRP